MNPMKKHLFLTLLTVCVLFSCQKGNEGGTSGGVDPVGPIGPVDPTPAVVPIVPVEKETDLSTIGTDYVAGNGELLKGILGKAVKISIAANSCVYLQNVTISGSTEKDFAGITCEGDATIVLQGSSSIRGFKATCPGIFIPAEHTLCLDGEGTLQVRSNGFSSGIGGNGNLVIKNGEIEAHGGYGASGIGSQRYFDGEPNGEPASWDMSKPAGASHAVSGNRSGDISGTPWKYEQWESSMSSSMMYYYDNGTFRASWNNPSDYIARVGFRYGSNYEKSHLTRNFGADYWYNRSGSAQYGSVGAYGWTVDPLTEFYIIDDWFSNNPEAYLGKKFGELTVDGATYDIYAYLRINAPSLQGEKTFLQITSLRASQRKKGHINISAHFNKWDELFHGQTESVPSTSGTSAYTVQFGKLSELSLLCEVDGNGSGNIEYTYFDLRDNYNDGRSLADCSFGNIWILGGKVSSFGGENAAGIGSGKSSACGNITIGANIVSVRSVAGVSAESIGKGKDGSCGTVEIADESKVVRD